MRAMPHVWALEKVESAGPIDLLEKALAIDPHTRSRCRLRVGAMPSAGFTIGRTISRAARQWRARSPNGRQRLVVTILSFWQFSARCILSCATMEQRGYCSNALSRLIPMPRGPGVGSEGLRTILINLEGDRTF